MEEEALHMELLHSCSSDPPASRLFASSTLSASSRKSRKELFQGPYMQLSKWKHPGSSLSGGAAGPPPPAADPDLTSYLVTIRVCPSSILLC